MLFTWLSNHITTRANVFSFDLSVQICDPPYYPGAEYPFKAYKVNQGYSRKQILGALDRSTTLRVKPDGSCDFNGDVDVKMLRVTDDLRSY